MNGHALTDEQQADVIAAALTRSYGQPTARHEEHT